jgi:hypothetical protein
MSSPTDVKVDIPADPKKEPLLDGAAEDAAPAAPSAIVTGLKWVVSTVLLLPIYALLFGLDFVLMIIT